MKPKLDNDTRQILTEKIKGYFLQEREEEIGDLQAMLILDFIISELAPIFYNQGIRDSGAWLAKKLEDMHELEIHNRDSRH